MDFADKHLMGKKVERSFDQFPENVVNPAATPIAPTSAPATATPATPATTSTTPQSSP
jgi:hypothetical protein